MMDKVSWADISLNRTQRENFGLTALDHLADLVAHDETCADLDPLLCLAHIQIARRFGDEVRWMKNCAEHLAYEESLLK